MEDYKVLSSAYKKLFYLTGNIVFFNAYKFTLENKTAVYLEEDNALQL